jgi:hypothetical protein
MSGVEDRQEAALGLEKAGVGEGRQGKDGEEDDE